MIGVGPMTAAERIASLKKKRNALILVHNYCSKEVQDIADHIGDSLGLSIVAAGTDADVIVFCGVSFMAESAKLLNPSKVVLNPEPDAHCPMASMCTAEQLRLERARRPGTAIVGYVNSTASSKAEMDMCCTSSNAVDAVLSLKDDDILFVPDRNLGTYVASKVRKKVKLWEGYCPVHQSITPENIAALKERHPKAVVLAHPECRMSVLGMADRIGSTEQMVRSLKETDADEFIVATEVGLRHRLEKEAPGRSFRFVDHAVCSVMKMTTVGSVIRALENMDHEVVIDPEIMERAAVPLKRMIELK
jgi:quinolinate synthase